jgi:hypothetical protein
VDWDDTKGFPEVQLRLRRAPVIARRRDPNSQIIGSP